VVKWGDHAARTVRWAIHDLLSIESDSVFDTPSRKSKANASRMAFLFEKGQYNLPDDQRPDCHKAGEHSYVSVYGRLRWDRPAQTITTGFGSMGQGRYVHPQRRRTITPHEAARLQTFPDWFVFGENAPRGVLAKAIGNAVPPLLMVELGGLIMCAVAQAVETKGERKRA
jgi:DNA (cytosine-5)-methyltransferase 1